MTKIVTFLGTRPEIIKLSPLLPLLTDICDQHILVHSGQHYSYGMDAVFFAELNLPAPDFALNVGSGMHGAQTARMLSRMEEIIVDARPDMVIVQGDTNTAFAGAITAVKQGVKLAHIEAGCRSFNNAMPEEINRVLIDHCAHYLFAPDAIAVANLCAEACQRTGTIFSTGSTSYDAVRRNMDYAGKRTLVAELGLKAGHYLLVTCHRAENTTAEVLPGIVHSISALAEEYPVLFPIHPRTLASLKRENLTFGPGVRLIEPLGYLDMLAAMQQATAVLTDSGGIQEEAAALDVPVLVMRNETEWSYLVTAGKAALIGTSAASIQEGASAILQSDRVVHMHEAALPAASGAGAAQRIANHLKGILDTL